MIKLSNNTIDKAGICTSMICLLHCLAFPVLFILGVDSILWLTEIEWIEYFIVFSSFIIGLIAFLGGYFSHKQHFVPVLFSAGFLLLINGEAVTHQWLGVGLSVAGAVIIAYAHYQNLSFKQKTYGQ